MHRVDARTQVNVTREQISLKEVLEVLWARRWLAVAFTATLVVGAIIAAWLAPRKYEASVLVSVVTQSPGGSQISALASVASQFSGLASLAGLSVATNTRRAETIAVLQSRALTEDYIKQNDLLPVLYPKRWDSATKRWKVGVKVPNLWKANRYFKSKIRAVTENAKTGLVTLTITWKDPVVAAQWANGLIEATNDYLRGQAIAEADRNIAYLEDQASKTDMVGVRQAIYSILENQIDKAMLARGTEQYALKILDPAAPPDMLSSPKPVMWTLLALFAGLLLSLFAAFVKVAWRSA
jgi:uncharacterized protein involved in exopolysaccharide biosynthesis